MSLLGNQLQVDPVQSDADRSITSESEMGPIRGARQTARLTLHRLAPQNARHGWTRAIVHHGALVVADLLALGAVVALYLGVRGGVIGTPLAEFARAIVPAGYVRLGEFTAALLLALLITGNYGYGDARREPGRLLGATALATALVLWAAVWRFQPQVVLGQYLVVTIVVCVALLLDRVLVDLWLQRFAPQSVIAPRTVFVGTPSDCEEVHAKGVFGWDRDYTYLGCVDSGDQMADVATSRSLGNMSDLPSLLDSLKVQWVVACSPIQEDRFHSVLDAAAVAGCKLFAAPKWLVNSGMDPSVVWRRGHGLLELTPRASLPLRSALEHAPGGFYHKIGKRALDLVGATVGIALGALPVLAAAVAMRIESRGPVFILQPRVGRGGRIFEILKLRTMVANAERNGAQWTTAGDPRITLVGRWVRRLRIDEVPQFFNVLLGQMSLVGPRPERPELHDQIAVRYPAFATRVAVKPGISGFAQIYDGYADSVESSRNKLDYDRRYIANVSLGLDLSLLAKTVKVVLTGHGSR